MKGDIYYLKLDLTGEIVAKFEIENFVPSIRDDLIPSSIGGKCYVASSWTKDADGKYTIPVDWEFFADGWFKWDGCTHWYFLGEDHIDRQTGIDAYYHLCGSYCLARHLRMHCFVWKLMDTLMGDDHTYNDYREHEELNEIITLMLDGYSIVKEEKNI